jgi:4-amino-4-deoxy-L-arabinose transferase-like glycosyltransferase
MIDHPPPTARAKRRLFFTRYSPYAVWLVFIAMLIVSWRRWTAVIADSGREMDLPLRLLQGELLYRDVHYLYPPLAPYLNAQLYRFFGVHLDVLHASGMVCSLLIAWLCYRSARRIFTAAEASLATAAVVVLCVFKPAGGLIAPYAFAALYGTVCALGTLLLMLRYAEQGKRRELIGAGVLIGLATITKLEFALTGAATVIAALVYLHRTHWQKLLRALALTAAPTLLIAVPVYAWLLQTIGWQTLVEDCHIFYTHLPAPLVFYNAHRTGLDRPWFSLAQMLGAAAVGVMILSAITLLSDRQRKVLKPTLLIFSGAVLTTVLVRVLVGKQWDGSPLRALPILLLVIMISEWRKFVVPALAGKSWRHALSAKDETMNNAALFIIAAYSLAMLARVALRVPSGGAFGGFFLPTALMLFFYLFLVALPERLNSWTQDAVTVRRAQWWGRGLLVVTVIATAIIFSIRYRRNYTYEIATPRGHLFAPANSGPAINEAVNFLQTHTRPNEAIAVLPEGSDLTFLTARRMPLRHQIMIPGLLNEQDEQAAINQLQQHDVRYLLIVNRPMREFGAEALGRDFYTTLGAWIDANYQVIKVCGAPLDARRQIGDARFFIKIYARVNGAPLPPVLPIARSP